MTTLVNGRYSDSLDVDDRGLAYGDGLFETLKVVNGKVMYFQAHLARLARGCRRLNILCDSKTIEADVSSLLLRHEERAGIAIIKIIVTREATGRSYQTHAHAGSNRIVSLINYSPVHTVNQDSGVSVIVCNTRLSFNPVLAGIKHLCRLENVLARAEWNSQAIAEGLLLDNCGRLIEGTMSNVFLVKQGCLFTPSLHRCGVEGVIRAQIMLNVGKQLGLQVEVSDLTLDDVYKANEVFLCNSIIGIWPVTSIGCHQKPIGDITRKLQQFLALQVDGL